MNRVQLERHVDINDVKLKNGDMEKNICNAGTEHRLQYLSKE